MWSARTQKRKARRGVATTVQNLEQRLVLSAATTPKVVATATMLPINGPILEGIETGIFDLTVDQVRGASSKVPGIEVKAPAGVFIRVYLGNKLYSSALIGPLGEADILIAAGVKPAVVKKKVDLVFHVTLEDQIGGEAIQDGTAGPTGVLLRHGNNRAFQMGVTSQGVFIHIDRNGSINTNPGPGPGPINPGPGPGPGPGPINPGPGPIDPGPQVGTYSFDELQIGLTMTHTDFFTGIRGEDITQVGRTVYLHISPAGGGDVGPAIGSAVVGSDGRYEIVVPPMAFADGEFRNIQVRSYSTAFHADQPLSLSFGNQLDTLFSSFDGIVWNTMY